MAIILGADLAGKELKSIIKNYLVENNYEVVDVVEIQLVISLKPH